MHCIDILISLLDLTCMGYVFYGMLDNKRLKMALAHSQESGLLSRPFSCGSRLSLLTKDPKTDTQDFRC